MKFIIKTTEELVEVYERLAQNARESIGKTRTKIESNEFKGQVMAFNEAIFYLKQLIRSQKEAEDAKSTEQMDAVDALAASDLNIANNSGDSTSSSKVKPI